MRLEITDTLCLCLRKEVRPQSRCFSHRTASSFRSSFSSSTYCVSSSSFLHYLLLVFLLLLVHLSPFEEEADNSSQGGTWAPHPPLSPPAPSSSSFISRSFSLPSSSSEIMDRRAREHTIARRGNPASAWQPIVQWRGWRGEGGEGGASLLFGCRCGEGPRRGGGRGWRGRGEGGGRGRSRFCSTRPLRPLQVN